MDCVKCRVGGRAEGASALSLVTSSCGTQKISKCCEVGPSLSISSPIVICVHFCAQCAPDRDGYHITVLRVSDSGSRVEQSQWCASAAQASQF